MRENGAQGGRLEVGFVGGRQEDGRTPQARQKRASDGRMGEQGRRARRQGRKYLRRRTGEDGMGRPAQASQVPLAEGEPEEQ